MLRPGMVMLRLITYTNHLYILELVLYLPLGVGLLFALQFRAARRSILVQGHGGRDSTLIESDEAIRRSSGSCSS